MLSIQSVWDDTLAFMKREQALLGPLALATIGLGDVVMQLLQGAAKDQTQTALGAALTFVAFLALLWTLVGELAIITLALRPNCSVREALGHGVQRLGRVIAAEIIIGFAFGLLLAPALVPMMAQVHGVVTEISQLHPNAPEMLWLIAVVLLYTFIYVRIIPLRPILLDRDIGVIQAFKSAFAMTRGAFWPIFGAMATIILLLLVISLSSHFVLGSLFTLIGKMIESPFTGTVLDALVQSFIAAISGMIIAVFVAMFYRRLSGNDATLGSIFK